jgi:ankyrin repeat protein
VTSNNISLDFVSSHNETFLQMAISYQNYEIIDLLLKKDININNQESEYGICALHQAIILNDKILCKKILKYNEININLQDYFGNTSLIYAVNELNLEIIELLLIQPNLNFNLINLEGNTALHILLLKENININLEKFIKYTDLSIQNNLGDTCLFLLIKNNIFLKYENILKIKELNIFIKNLNDIKPFDIIKNNNEILNIIIESYYNQLIKNKNNLLIDWEVWCSNEKEKNNKEKNNKEKNNKEKNNKEKEKTCKKKIKDNILNMERSIPKINDLHINIDSGIYVNYCFYTGSTIDILCGLIFLYNKFKNFGLEIIIDFPLTQHDLLKQYYQNIGISNDFKLDIINFEIVWSFQKIIYPTYFNFQIKNKIKTAKYIVIPLGIETSFGSHANILFWDVKNKVIERFEPNGSNQPNGINYNPFILDTILFNKFKNFDNNIKYIKPIDYLPIIGFQMLENFNNKCKKIGDPNGFCGVWCIWWIFQKLSNINIESSNLVSKLIKEIKYNNINFKTLIRNFSKNITDIRDNYLNKFNIDINDWITGNYDDNLLNKLDKLIIDSIL